MLLLSTVVDTPDGPFAIVAREDCAVVASGWGTLGQVMEQGHVDITPVPVPTLPSADAVRAYYDGDTAAPGRIPVAQEGSELELAVWSQLRAIPAGQTRSYGQIADAVGNPKGARAVGGACGRNTAALFVPCHRVVAADGALGGFAWGIDVKQHLLDRERVTRDMPQV